MPTLMAATRSRSVMRRLLRVPEPPWVRPPMHGAQVGPPSVNGLLRGLPQPPWAIRPMQRAILRWPSALHRPPSNKVLLLSAGTPMPLAAVRRPSVPVHVLPGIAQFLEVRVPTLLVISRWRLEMRRSPLASLILLSATAPTPLVAAQRRLANRRWLAGSHRLHSAFPLGRGGRAQLLSGRGPTLLAPMPLPWAHRR